MPDTFNRTQPRCEPLDTRRIKPLLTFGARRGESGAGMHNRPHTSQAMQQLPSSGPAREALREKGQFWTPAWLATVMASWVTAHGPRVLFDPAVGPGTFFAAARQAGFAGGFAGFELHGSALTGGCAPGLAAAELRHVTIGDFISSQLLRTFPAIVSNPPYIRHHRLSGKQKEELQTLAQRCLGFTLDGRAGLHLYFLLKCLDHLAPGGRLAFLLPADVCEGVSSRAVWGRLAARFRLDAVLMFEEPAAPFPAVDTNAMVFLFSNLAPRPRVPWLRVRKPDPAAVLQALGLKTGSGAGPTGDAVTTQVRELPELVATGLSRPPRPSGSRGVALSLFARVVRGIATGANEFFFLTSSQLAEYGLDRRFFRRAIGRTRDCPDGTLTPGRLDALDAAGRPTWLLSLDRRPRETLPPALSAYLQRGEEAGLARRALIKTRTPWYRMEQREEPPLLFAYLGRRDCRFLLNRAGAVPLTGFLCVYPWDRSERHVRELWQALNHPDTLANLAFVGKSYGGGALKVEPRQLDALEIPQHVLDRSESLSEKLAELKARPHPLS
jgi:hypothetical protein